MKEPYSLRLFGRALCGGAGLGRRLGVHFPAEQLHPRAVGRLLIGMAGGGRRRFGCLCRVRVGAGISGERRRCQSEEGRRRTEEDRLT